MEVVKVLLEHKADIDKATKVQQAMRVGVVGVCKGMKGLGCGGQGCEHVTKR